MSAEKRPVDAVCTGCKRTRVKWADDDLTGLTFRHVWHVRHGVTYWNICTRLAGLEEGDGQ